VSALVSISPRTRLGWPQVAGIGVGLAVLSLLVLRVPAYDPTAWLIWGRQISHGTLDMVGGPSWKPLPVAFTTLFAFAGSTVAPWLWLFVARLAGLTALALTFVLARRLGGRTAGIVAAAGLALGTNFLFNAVRGDSEGLLVALVLGAVLLHLEDRRWVAFAVGVLACGLRPEVWTLLGLYGVWLIWTERRAATVAYVAAGGALILAAWFLPDYLSTGEFFRGATRATHPVPGTPGQSAFPFGSALLLGLVFLVWPLYAGAVAAVREGDRAVVVLAAGAAGLMLVVAAMAQAGFTGNIRYATLPGALACVVGGVGLPGLVERARVRLRPRVAQGLALLGVAAVCVSVGVVVVNVANLVKQEREWGGALTAAIDRAGGPAAVRDCGRVQTAPFERQVLAYRLELPPRVVFTHGSHQGIAFVLDGKTLPEAALLPVAARTRGWTIRTSCSLAGAK
jgi:hypothetical protein